jgi:opacity protein-like surface antigen
MKIINKVGLMLVAVLLIAVGDASAQRLKININYSAAMPASSNFKNFVGENSLRGWNANLLYDVSDQLSLGLGVGSQSFYERFPRGVYKTAEGSDLSAVVTNTVTTMPVLAQGQFNLLPEAAIQPYVGLGVGGNVIMYNQYVGEFSNARTKFGFAARPEAGVYIPVGRFKESSIVIGGAYNYMPFKMGDLQNLNQLGLHAGFKFPLK